MMTKRMTGSWPFWLCSEGTHDVGSTHLQTMTYHLAVDLYPFRPDSGIVMVDGTFIGDSFEQDRPWDDSGTTISGI